MDLIPFFGKIVRTFRGSDNSKSFSDRLKAPRPRRLQIEPLEDRALLAVCYVDANATGIGGDGTSWGNAVKTLQEALDFAAISSRNITEIWVAEGTYIPSKLTNTNDSRSATFSLINGVSIYGGFAGNETNKNARAVVNGEYVYQTILSGDLGRNDDLSNPDTVKDNAYSVLYGAPNLTIDGLTITGGNARIYSSGFSTQVERYGGGIVLVNCTNVTLENLNIARNNADGGGGVSISGGSTTIKGCSITENFATGYGGGIRFESGTLTVQESVIADNSANSGGGGLYQAAGTLNVSTSHFSGNAGMYGGGLLQDNGTGTITTSSFISNVAPNRYSTQGQGGGICQFGVMNISSTTVANNVAGFGGGIFFSNNADGQSPMVESTYSNLTISQNVAQSTDARGGGIYIVSGLLNLDASIVAANTATTTPDIYGELATGGGSKTTLVLSGSNNVIGVGTGIPAVPGTSTKITIANNSQGNQVGTTGSPLNPQTGAPTDFGNGVFVLPLLTGSPALGQGMRIGVVDTATAERSGQTYLVTSLEDAIGIPEQLTFREAFEAANRNIVVGNAPAGSFTQTDTITFAPGLTGTVDLNGKALTVYGGLTISGWTTSLSSDISSPGAMNYLSINAGYQSSVVKAVGNINVNISEITLENGCSSVNGGGMVAYSSNITLNKVAIRNSHSTGQEGGGGFYSRNATLNATDIIVSGCSATVSGGGMLLHTTNATIVGASIYQNSAREEGGGLFMTSRNGSSIISNATFAQNRASHGGGLALLETTVRLTHLTVTKNVGDYIGGLMVGALATVQMNNSIVADNFSYVSPDLEVYHDENDTDFNAVLGGSFNLIGNNTGLRNGLTTGSQNNKIGTATAPINPQFTGPSYYNGQMIYPLSSSSPAVDSGNNGLSLGSGNTALVYDVRGPGYLRFVSKTGNTVDMGACEYQANLVGSIDAPQGTTIRFGQELNFEGRVVTGSTPGQKFLWDFNNNGIFGEIGDWGTQGGEFGEIVKFLSEGIIPEPGLYPIRLIVEDSAGRRSDPFELGINILVEAPTYVISGNTSFYAREAGRWEIVAENTQNDPIMRWIVRWGDTIETIINGGPRNRISIHHLYANTGIYNVEVETTSFFGDVQYFHLTFQVLARPAAVAMPVDWELDMPNTTLLEEMPTVLSEPLASATQAKEVASPRLWEEGGADDRFLIEGEVANNIATLALYEQATDRVLADWTNFDDFLTTGKKGGLFD